MTAVTFDVAFDAGAIAKRSKRRPCREYIWNLELLPSNLPFPHPRLLFVNVSEDAYPVDMIEYIIYPLLVVLFRTMILR